MAAQLFRNTRFLLLGSLCLLATAAVVVGCAAGTTAATTTTTGGGTGGTSGAGTWTGKGDGVWRRNAVINEAISFDPCNAHQPGSGEYHYHANPTCLRYQLNDNITATNVGTVNARYAETTGTPTHSPILGWSYDGYPVYGPYGYSDPTRISAVRRIQSSFALRSIIVRQSLPSWAASTHGVTSTTLTSAQYGPNVSATYPLGHYAEDYDYAAGAGDLDQYNGRFTVTPEFPSGTYAYFVTIDSAGAPAFPYYISGQYYGSVTGGAVTAVSETTTTYFANQTLQTGSSTVALIKSWMTAFSGQYAKIIDERGSTSTTVTTWTGNTTATYADPQTIRYSATWVYLNMSGLASHVMGPWYLDAGKTQAFPNYPTNQNSLARFPITPVAATTHIATGGGAQGRWVNGVAMFNMLDYGSYINATASDSN